MSHYRTSTSHLRKTVIRIETTKHNIYVIRHTLLRSPFWTKVGLFVSSPAIFSASPIVIMVLRSQWSWIDGLTKLTNKSRDLRRLSTCLPAWWGSTHSVVLTTVSWIHLMCPSSRSVSRCSSASTRRRTCTHFRSYIGHSTDHVGCWILMIMRCTSVVRRWWFTRVWSRSCTIV